MCAVIAGLRKDVLKHVFEFGFKRKKRKVMRRKVLAPGEGREGTDRDALFAFSPSPDSLFPIPLLDVFLLLLLPGPLSGSARGGIDAEEMTELHVPLHTMLHLVLTAHGCQMTELKTNVGAVDDHELL